MVARVPPATPDDDSSAVPLVRVLTANRSEDYHRVIYGAMPEWVTDDDLPPYLLLDAAARPRRLARWRRRSEPALGAALEAFDVFHLHWPEWLPQRSDPRAHERLIAALGRAGVAIVWTQHNLVPHDKQTRGAIVHQLWADAAAGVIHHTHWGERVSREKYRFRTDAAQCIIPHPHFGPVLASRGWSRPEVEDELGLRRGALRLAVVGYPRVEKDVDLAMRAVAAARRTDVELLVVCLWPGQDPVADSRIVAFPYEEVARAVYDDRLRAVDALVMPFRPTGMLTTGTVGDAVAHGLPCIVSDWPFLAEALPGATIPYGRTAEDLTACIDGLTTQALTAARAGAIALRRSMSPELIARATAELLRQAVAVERSRAGRP
ncbi:MAG TPA: hypothetical protein VEH55_08075 [Gaiellaceae bacterium]|nr:hypothetical protein [Gaiellaceae bacterium]